MTVMDNNLTSKTVDTQCVWIPLIHTVFVFMPSMSTVQPITTAGGDTRHTDAVCEYCSMFKSTQSNTGEPFCKPTYNATKYVQKHQFFECIFLLLFTI